MIWWVKLAGAAHKCLLGPLSSRLCETRGGGDCVAYHLYHICPSDHTKQAGQHLDDITAICIVRVVEASTGSGGQVALVKHSQK